MQAARLHAAGDMRIEDLARPAPAAGELLVRVLATGICGSDRHMFRGEYPTAKPVTLGHEFCGVVEATGAGVTGFDAGTMISGDPNISCGTCAHCASGRPNLCAELTPIGVMRDGGFAEYVIVPAGQAAALPTGIDPRHGAFCEPVSCCLHAIDVARIPKGGSVLIIGGGVIGLLMIELALLAGAGTVVLSTRQAARRALALELGAQHAVDASGPDGDAAVHAILPEGADVVFECAGVGETVVQSIRLARRGGAVILFGVVPQDATVTISPYDLLTRQLRFEGAWLNPLTHGRAAELIASGALSLDRLITHTVALADVPGVLAANPAPGEIKVMMVAN
ncbi:MAG: zinc-dependent alcohol dehydrogenase family protein [Devosia sp.]